MLQPSHGFTIWKAAQHDSISAVGLPLPFGQVYATLARLARDGKVVAGSSEPGAGPDRKRYVITDDGVAEVESWLAEPVEPSRTSRRCCSPR